MNRSAGGTDVCVLGKQDQGVVHARSGAPLWEGHAEVGFEEAGEGAVAGTDLPAECGQGAVVGRVRAPATGGEAAPRARGGFLTSIRPFDLGGPSRPATNPLSR
jgi:hypothetical protein